MLSYRWSDALPPARRRLHIVSPRRRVLVRVGRHNVYSYPSALYTGLVCGVYAGCALVPDADVTPFALAMVVLLVPALAGARLLFVAAHWSTYRGEPRRILRRSEGGMAMYGGLLLALPLSIPLVRAVGLPFGEFWDGATATMILGAAFTRVGCFLNGCCAGPRVPTPLLECVACLGLFAGLVALWPVFPFTGAALLYGLATYGLLRFSLEFTRARARTITFAQVVSATAVLVCVPLYLALWLA